jgi:uncharacterized membrane protein YphA (DoxX/SURF4 family)
MAHRIVVESAEAPPVARSFAIERSAAKDAYTILHLGFTLLPIIAGLDKFFHLLVNWDQYLSPRIAALLPVAPHTFMQIVGGIEIVAGLLVAVRPRIGAYVVAAWLWGIIVNLLMLPGYYDVALRDFGLSLGALALGRLSCHYDQHPSVARERGF